jgi:regulator of replication initiation timing
MSEIIKSNTELTFNTLMGMKKSGLTEKDKLLYNATIEDLKLMNKNIETLISDNQLLKKGFDNLSEETKKINTEIQEMKEILLSMKHNKENEKKAWAWDIMVNFLKKKATIVIIIIMILLFLGFSRTDLVSLAFKTV